MIAMGLPGASSPAVNALPSHQHDAISAPAAVGAAPAVEEAGETSSSVAATGCQASGRFRLPRRRASESFAPASPDASLQRLWGISSWIWRQLPRDCQCLAKTDRHWSPSCRGTRDATRQRARAWQGERWIATWPT